MSVTIGCRPDQYRNIPNGSNVLSQLRYLQVLEGIEDLPTDLKPNAVYFVRDGDSIDMYVVNNDGSAYEKFEITNEVFTVDSIAELRTYRGFNDIAVILRGYYEQGDGCDGKFYWDTSSTETDNGGTVIQATGVITGRWIRIYDDSINVRWFGAKGDGISDDIDSFLNVQGFPSILIPKGTYYLSGNVDFRSSFLHAIDAKIVLTDTDNYITLGGLSSASDNPKQHLKSILRSTANTNPEVIIMGAKGQHITIERCTYVQLMADSDATNAGSIAYSTFDFKYVNKIHLTTNPAPAGSLVQWINENIFNLNRVKEVLIEGTYVHNHNIFNAGSFESGAIINIVNGSSNCFYNIRGESGISVTFESGASFNKIIRTWSSSSVQFFREIGTEPIVDNGVGNYYKLEYSLERDTIVTGSISCKDVILNNQVHHPYILPTLHYIRGNATFQFMFSTDFVQVRKNDVLGFVTDNVLSEYRFYLEFYDVNKKPLNITLNTHYLSSGMTTVSGNIANSSATGMSAAMIISSDVKYVIFKVYSGSSGEIADQKSSEIITYIRRMPSSSTISYDGTTSPDIKYPKIHLVTSAIIQGFAPLGYLARNTTSSINYFCSFSLKTAVNANHVTSDTVITLSVVTGISSGFIIGILLDNMETHWSSVVSIAGSNVTIANPLPSNASIGCFVGVNNWTAL